MVGGDFPVMEAGVGPRFAGGRLGRIQPDRLLEAGRRNRVAASGAGRQRLAGAGFSARGQMQAGFAAQACRRKIRGVVGAARGQFAHQLIARRRRCAPGLVFGRLRIVPDYCEHAGGPCGARCGRPGGQCQHRLEPFDGGPQASGLPDPVRRAVVHRGGGIRLVAIRALAHGAQAIAGLLVQRGVEVFGNGLGLARLGRGFGPRGAAGRRRNQPRGFVRKGIGGRCQQRAAPVVQELRREVGHAGNDGGGAGRGGQQDQGEVF